MKALIVGTGFGSLYKEIYEDWGWETVTVDLFDTNADFRRITDIKKQVFNTAHICTPNWTHFDLADQAAKISEIVFVEKPGVRFSEQWKLLLDSNIDTRFMMTKNNQYRDNIEEIKQAIGILVEISWSNKNRIPNPGSWFTTKDLAFGGVSRDLMPHLLSIYQMLNPQWKQYKRTHYKLDQQWNLSNIERSDYGTVVENGVYNVDDFCSIQFEKFLLNANWRSNEEDDIAIHTGNKTFELGLCPEYAYANMIKDALNNINNNDFWNNQRSMDLWIHQQLETM